jgi:hypothetical protein
MPKYMIENKDTVEANVVEKIYLFKIVLDNCQPFCL